jgi:excisionase family DNA binding protein
MSDGTQTRKTLLTVDRRLLRIAEAAQYLSTTVRAIRTLIWRREIPFCEIGQRYLIDVRDLDAYVEKIKRTA